MVTATIPVGLECILAAAKMLPNCLIEFAHKCLTILCRNNQE